MQNLQFHPKTTNTRTNHQRDQQGINFNANPSRITTSSSRQSEPPRTAQNQMQHHRSRSNPSMRNRGSGNFENQEIPRSSLVSRQMTQIHPVQHQRAHSNVVSGVRSDKHESRGLHPAIQSNRLIVRPVIREQEPAPNLYVDDSISRQNEGPPTARNNSRFVPTSGGSNKGECCCCNCCTAEAWFSSTVGKYTTAVLSLFLSISTGYAAHDGLMDIKNFNHTSDSIVNNTNHSLMNNQTRYDDHSSELLELKKLTGLTLASSVGFGIVSLVFLMTALRDSFALTVDKATGAYKVKGWWAKGLLPPRMTQQEFNEGFKKFNNNQRPGSESEVPVRVVGNDDVLNVSACYTDPEVSICGNNWHSSTMGKTVWGTLSLMGALGIGLTSSNWEEEESLALVIVSTILTVGMGLTSLYLLTMVVRDTWCLQSDRDGNLSSDFTDSALPPNFKRLSEVGNQPVTDRPTQRPNPLSRSAASQSAQRVESQHPNEPRVITGNDGIEYFVSHNQLTGATELIPIPSRDSRRNPFAHRVEVVNDDDDEF